MKVDQDKLWAGSEEASHAYFQAMQSVSQMKAGGDDDEDDDESGDPRLLDIQDGVAIISIHGTLVNSSNWYNKYFGMVGYSEIREALLAAAGDPSVTHILLDVSSGGGTVSGVEDTAKLIRLINDRVKPVFAHIDGIGASAAYWLACSSSKVYAGKTAVVGSIGVIAVHREYSEYYKAQGIGVKVLRAGSEKALANPNEPLTKAGEAQIMQAIDAVYEVFVDHVAAMRGKSYDYTDKNMADGKEFIGQAAVDTGLIDGILTFDTLMTDLKAKSIDASEKLMDNRNKPMSRFPASGQSFIPGDTSMSKQALTEQDIAALAAGGTVALADAGQVAAVDGGDTVEAGAAATAPAPEAAATTDSKNHDNSAGTIQFMTEQLASKDKDLIQARVDLAQAQASVQSLEASQAPLLSIAIKAINNMQVALGGSASDMSGLTASAVVAEHERLSKDFAAKYKAGGVSAVSAGTDANKAPVVDNLTLARLNAVRNNK